MDCFFVSVGLRSHPHLKGKPVAVTHSKGAPNKKSDDLTSKKKEFEMYNKRRKVINTLMNVLIQFMYIFSLN